MRILHFIPSVDPATGGPAEGLKQLSDIYHMGGHEVEIASLDSPEMVRKFDFPAKVIGLGPGRGVYGYTPHAIPWLKANISRFDIVLVNCPWQYNAFAIHRVIRGTGIPYAVFAHGMLDPYFKRRFPLKHVKKLFYWHGFLKRILRDAYAVFFTSEEEKILARQSFPGYQVREMVVPYGTFGPNCDTAVAAEEFLDRWPTLRGKRLAIALGRIHPKKGIDILIETFADTLAKDPDWHLVIAGPDQVGLQAQLEALAAKLGIARRIAWPGMLEGTIKWGAFAASEVFVLPSHQENFGIVVAEALACGLPVIVSDKVNIWREIDSCGAGLVCADTVEGTKASLGQWSALTPLEIAEVRIRSRKCFDELFNYRATSKKVLNNIERMATTNPRYLRDSPEVAGFQSHRTLP
jgi:glycosyltransferase involved in cell wall biosynthesis